MNTDDARMDRGQRLARGSGGRQGSPSAYRSDHAAYGWYRSSRHPGWWCRLADCTNGLGLAGRVSSRPSCAVHLGRLNPLGLNNPRPHSSRTDREAAAVLPSLVRNEKWCQLFGDRARVDLACLACRAGATATVGVTGQKVWTTWARLGLAVLLAPHRPRRPEAAGDPSRLTSTSPASRCAAAPHR